MDRAFITSGTMRNGQYKMLVEKAERKVHFRALDTRKVVGKYGNNFKGAKRVNAKGLIWLRVMPRE
jgi:hypothetical protein